MVAFLVFTERDPFLGVNAGFISFCVNAVITVVISLLAPDQRGGFDEDVMEEVPDNEALRES